MFKEVQQQAYGSSVGETPLPLVGSTKFRRKKMKWKVKLRVENGGHLPKFDGRRAQEHLVKLGRRRKIWFLSPKASVK